jgi:hypothetical protein
MDGPLLGFQAPQTDLAIIQGRFVCMSMKKGVNREVAAMNWLAQSGKSRQTFGNFHGRGLGGWLVQRHDVQT